jgi:para-nitrobenzyl esterase
MPRPILGATAAILFAAAAAALAQSPPTAKVAQGVLSGAAQDGVFVFRGVPYAAPPVGQRRWAPPAAPAAWGSAPRDATKFSAACPQTPAPAGRPPWTIEYMHPVAQGFSEDCLYLNVWTPARVGEKTPVLVWLHGGGYVEGSGSIPIYNGASLARKGVVVVTINYRLGPFAAFAHPELTAEQGGSSGNYGFQDQIAALRWVKDNIAAFGGDPDQVTLAGQSAGAGSVLTLMAAPPAKGLFRGAIVESGGIPSESPRSPLSTGEQAGVESLQKAGVQTLAQARALTTAQVMAAGFRRASYADGRTVPVDAPVRPGVMPMMMGFTLHDLSSGGRRHPTAAAWKADVAARYGDKADAFLKLYPGDTDAQAGVSANREVAERSYLLPLAAWSGKATGSAPLYGYLFSHVEPGPEADKWGAFHTSEVPYAFNTIRLSPDRPFTVEDRSLSDKMSSYWANFVKYGNPNGAGLPPWPALTAADKMVMELNDTIQPVRAAPAAVEPLYAAAKPPGRPTP